LAEPLTTNDDQLAAVKKTRRPSVPATYTSISSSVKTMAWIYPGNPACGAGTEYTDGRKIDVLKPEFFTISGGTLVLLTTTNTTCNGYSPALITKLKQYSTEQYVTVSSASSEDMGIFLQRNNGGNAQDITTLTNFVVTHGLTGIELDFEDYGSWTPEQYSDFKTFVSTLGNTLHANGKKLMIDGPAISNASEENWFVWRYADFVTLPVDSMVVMVYDYQYDYGVGSPIAPFDWIRNVVAYTSSKYPKSKTTIGIPSYGYQGTKGTYKMAILTYEQMQKKTGFTSATRDPLSGEMTWQSGTIVYRYQDSISMQQKRSLIESLGISSVSVWHLGGNPWF